MKAESLKIKNKIILVILLTVTIAVLTSNGANILVSRRLVGELSNKEVVSQSATISTTIDTWLISHKNNILGLVDLLSSNGLEGTEESKKILERYYDRNHGMEYYAGFEDGSYIDGSGWIPSSDYVAKERDWYIDAMTSKSLMVSDPYVDAQYGDIIDNCIHVQTNIGR